MSTTMDQIHHIRELFYQQGKNISQIASETGLNRKTISKYVDMENFNSPLPTPASEEEHDSKLNPFKPLINEWLQADKLAPRKQRHTAKRIFRRLKEEANGFDCSYRLVALYVSERKKELHLKKSDGYLPLEHHPGEAQADFGFANFYEKGRLYENAKYLVLSFPFSNGGFLQLNYNENMECLLEGLVAMFEHIGGVPTEIWFDNTRTIVTEIIKGGRRNVTERFRRFCEYYRIKPIFMNPESGWEKGNVENKVGYLCRNELVPVPKFDSLVEENQYLLKRCEKDMQREHYDNSSHFICELFQEDKARLLPLPSIPFDTVLYTTSVTDKYGKFTLDAGKHRYSASPAFCEACVNLKITSSEVIVMDKDMHEVVCNKINCNHNNEECNAYLSDADEINYCDDMIYYISSEDDGDSSKYYLFCVSRDGKRKEKIVQVATLDPDDNGISFQMCIHRGKLYFNVLKQTTLEKRNASVYEIDLDGRHTWKEIASIEGHGAMIDDLAAYGNTLVVLGSYADSEDAEFRYYTNLVNLDNNEVKKDILYDKEKDEIFSFMDKDNLYYYSDSKLFSKNINTGEEKCISGNSMFYDDVYYDGNYIYTRNLNECRENNDYSDYRIDIYDLQGEMKGSIPMTEDMSWLHGYEDLFFVEEWTDEKVEIKIYDKTDITNNKTGWKSILTIQGEEYGD